MQCNAIWVLVSDLLLLCTEWSCCPPLLSLLHFPVSARLWCFIQWSNQCQCPIQSQVSQVYLIFADYVWANHVLSSIIYHNIFAHQSEYEVLSMKVSQDFDPLVLPITTWTTARSQCFHWFDGMTCIKTTSYSKHTWWSSCCCYCFRPSCRRFPYFSALFQTRTKWWLAQVFSMTTGWHALAMCPSLPVNRWQITNRVVSCCWSDADNDAHNHRRILDAQHNFSSSLLWSYVVAPGGFCLWLCVSRVVIVGWRFCVRTDELWLLPVVTFADPRQTDVV